MKKTLFLMVFLSMLLVSVANAVLTLQTTTWNSGTKVNITFGTGDYVGNATSSLAVYAACSDTANSSISKVFNITNDTTTNFNWGSANFTFSSDLVLEDSSLCSVTAEATGRGEAEDKTLSATTVLVDRTNPTAPTSVTFANPVKNTETITATVVGSETTNCYIRFGSTNAPRQAMALSGNTCTYTVTGNNPPDSTYESYVEASDGSDVTLSAMSSIEINAVTSDGGGVYGGTAVLTGTDNPLTPNNNGLQNLLKQPIVIFLIIGGIIWYLYNKK